MPLKQIAFLGTGCVAAFCLLAQFIYAAYLSANRPLAPDTVFCWPLKGFGLVFVTQHDHFIMSALSVVGFVALFMALLLRVSLKPRRRMR